MERHGWERPKSTTCENAERQKVLPPPASSCHSLPKWRSSPSRTRTSSHWNDGSAQREGRAGVITKPDRGVAGPCPEDQDAAPPEKGKAMRRPSTFWPRRWASMLPPSRSRAANRHRRRWSPSSAWMTRRSGRRLGRRTHAAPWVGGSSFRSVWTARRKCSSVVCQ